MYKLKSILISFFFVAVAFSPLAAYSQQCGSSINADIVLMIDRTGGLSGDEIRQEKASALALLDILTSGSNRPRVAIGTIEMDCNVTPCLMGGIRPGGNLTTDYDLLRTVVADIPEIGEGRTPLATAIDLAQFELDSRGQAGSDRFIALLSDGIPNIPNGNCSDVNCDCPSADVAANVSASVAEQKGTKIFGIHFGSSAIECPAEPAAGIDFMKNEISTASASDSFFFSGSKDLSGVLEAVAGEVSCDDGLSCTTDICSAGTDRCIFEEIDADNDGTGDCSDACPQDPAKSNPGVCGCGIPDIDSDGDGTADCNETNDTCESGEECIFEDLEPFACAGVNGFLSQTNIASVINLQATPLSVDVEYRDLTGNLLGQTSATVAGNNKQDFVINALGLQPDTYGTVCVKTNAEVDGAWSGGVTVYKPNLREGRSPLFGLDDDFALFHPFTNPKKGVLTQSLNTFHLGVRPDSTVANWLSLTDAIPGDGKGLTGEIVYFNANGQVTNTTRVNIADGGRFDFSAHEGVAGPNNDDTVGMARFVPDSSDSEYYIVLIRYFYDCFGASCADFHTAFVVPFRPATNVETSGNISTVNGELSVLEVNNVLPTSVNGRVTVAGQEGATVGTLNVDVPANGVRHTVVNKSGDFGFLSNNTIGSARVESAQSSLLSAVSVFYKLDDAGILQYAYASPLIKPAGSAQVADFNTFIGHTNSAEVFNPSDKIVSVNVRAIEVSGQQVADINISLDPRSSQRLDFSSLPKDTFGVYLVTSQPENVVFRNYITKEGQYVLPGLGR